MSKKLRFGLPKGSLQEATIQKMAKAGFNISVSSRSYMPYVDDDELEIRLIRAQEISRYVEHGYLDCGITGYDWIVENGSKVHEVGEFLFSKATRQPARWVLAVPENSPIKSVKDLKGKRIATEVVNLTKKYLAQARREGGGGIFLGRDRGEGARAGGRDRGIDRDRLLAAREQAAHRGHAAGLDAAADRQSHGVEGRVEAAEDRDAGVAAQGRAGSGGEGGLEDEHRREEPGEPAAKHCPRCATRPFPT